MKKTLEKAKESEGNKCYSEEKNKIPLFEVKASKNSCHKNKRDTNEN